MNEDPNLYTTDELAFELGIKPQTLRLWRSKSRKNGPKGPKWRVVRKNNSHHRYICYHQSDIDEWQNTLNNPIN